MSLRGRPPYPVKQVPESELQKGQLVWWPVAPNNWGSCIYGETGTWIPSAVVYVQAEQ